MIDGQDIRYGSKGEGRKQRVYLTKGIVGEAVQSRDDDHERQVIRVTDNY